MTEVATATDTADERGRLVFTRRDLGAMDARGSGWYGMILLILTEASLFAFLLFSYYYMALHYGRAWLPEERPSFKLSAPNTAILIASSVAVTPQRHARSRPGRTAGAGHHRLSLHARVMSLVQGARRMPGFNPLCEAGARRGALRSPPFGDQRHE